MPRIKNYGEWAGEGREIATQYGSIVGPLWDLNILMASDPTHVDDAVHAGAASKSGDQVPCPSS
jgi:hypothetical protein